MPEWQQWCAIRQRHILRFICVFVFVIMNFSLIDWRGRGVPQFALFLWGGTPVHIVFVARKDALNYIVIEQQTERLLSM